MISGFEERMRMQMLLFLDYSNKEYEYNTYISNISKDHNMAEQL